MDMDGAALYRSFLDELNGSFAKEAGLPRKLLRAQSANSAAFAAGFAAVQAQRRVQCGAVLALCRPLMEALCPEGAPAEGWLSYLYRYLGENLFPVAKPLRPKRAQKRAMDVYLFTLEWFLKREKEVCPYDPLSDIRPLTEEEAAASRIRSQYEHFLACIEASHFIALLRLGRDTQPFDPASHTIGVHHLALHLARQAVRAGVPVDLPLVSAAALTHDIGKFGCRGAEAQRIPYLHYYYTWQWLSKNGLPDIAHVAANHSTWDLEFENLPIESLLLICADFRVRGSRSEAGREHVHIHTLEEAYGIILSKLYNVTEEKRRRYTNAYCKLRDFERFLTGRGVNPDPLLDTPLPVAKKDAALCESGETLGALCAMIQDNNIRLMRSITTSASFEEMLEQARAEKNLQRIRSYLDLFSEYSTYMSPEHKLLTLHFLYELLMHPEGDVRRQAGEIMGRILCNSGPSYRKELPESAPHSAIAPTLHALLQSAASLWARYVEDCLHPDHKISAKHAARISNSLKTIAGSLFASCDASQRRNYWLPLFHQIDKAHAPERLILMDALGHIPADCIEAEEMERILAILREMLQESELEAICALRALLALLNGGGMELRARIAALCADCDFGHESTAALFLFNRLRVLAGLGELPLRQASLSDIYLSDLKTSVHWTIKHAHIDMLRLYARSHREEAFHIATHLSNIISVSEHLPVREHAGKALVEIALCMSPEEINEIVVDLMRELEAGQSEIVFYIPPYAGRLICRLPKKELDETIDFLEQLLRASQPRPARAALLTLGTVLQSHTLAAGEAGAEADAGLVRRIFGLLFTGLAHYDDRIHLTALRVLCRDLFAHKALPLSLRREFFMQTHKKLHTLLVESRDDKLVFFNRAAMLNELYRFIAACEVELGGFPFPPPLPAAFFPGTFDPFSAGHKRIVEEIRMQGFEVYLAVDEFSWSKQTLPKLLRRQIVRMSVADQSDVYLFPDDFPVNIAVKEDLARLRALFAGRDMYIVAGSDVIENASAYRDESPGAAPFYDHVIFSRVDAAGKNPSARKPEEIIKGKLRLLSLPAYYESASSTQIRSNIDKNMDITMLVDPVVQEFIYARGLYLRAPQYKNRAESQPLDLSFYKGREALRRLDAAAAQRMQALLEQRPDQVYAAFMRQSGADGQVLATALACSIGVRALYGMLGDKDAAECVRQSAAGRILFIGGIFAAEAGMKKALPLLCELLARSLDDDHSYAVYPTQGADDPFAAIFLQMGFLPVPGCEGLLLADMRTPLIFVQDALQRIKAPLCANPAVENVIRAMRPRLRASLCSLFPGKLLLSFDAELLNSLLLRKVQACNGVLNVPPGERRLGPCMCVPYGKILSGDVVPNTVTKTLHADKVFDEAARYFSITEYPGYSPLGVQVRTLKSFRRPVLLVDDILHNGYRLEKLDPLFKAENVRIERIIVGILSGRGLDLMRMQGRQVECGYFIPNLHYWFTESLLYPFLGGDSAACRTGSERALPSVNLILPYVYPRYLHGVPDVKLRDFSALCLENAYNIFRVLEEEHQKAFSTALTLNRLGEILHWPRIPDKGAHMAYDMHMPPSVYLLDDRKRGERIRRGED